MGIQVEVVARAPARLEVPRHAIGRDRLADALDRVPPAGLGLVVASAGSGKSVLLAQWEPTAPERHHCHLQLSASDADAVVCARHLLEELRRAAPSFPEGLETLVEAGGRALGEVFVDAVLTALAALDDGVLLVLDDLHRVAQAEVVEDLGRIVTGLPRNARAVVAARWDPVFSVRQVRLEGRLVEIRGAELAFEPSEGRDLVAAVVGSPVSDDQGAALVGRTEGWAAGLQMAAVAVTSAPDLTEAIATLAGDDRLVAEYLSAEVLDQQEPELRRFLLRTSVLEWLSAEVCDAVTGDGNGRRMLDEVARRSLFLVPLDRRGERYRYHHLFADLLRLRLRIEDPEGEVALHQAAATWLLSRDRFAEAVEHLLVAGDRDRALDLISREGHRLYERGESATLVRWMEALTQGPDDTPVVVSLNLLAAQVARDAASEATETYRRLSRRTDLSAEERATADAYFAVLVQCDLPPDEVRRAASAALDAIPSLDPLHMPEVLGLGGRDAVEALARFAAGQAAVMEGDSSAVGVLAELVSHPALRYPTWRVNLHGWLSIIQVWRGHLTMGGRDAEVAQETARAAGIPHHVAAATAHLASASIAFDRGQADVAAEHLQAAEVCTRRSGRGSLHCLLRLVRARHLAAVEGPWAGLDALRRPTATPIGPSIYATATDGYEASLLVQLGRHTQAETVLRRGGQHAALFPARVDLALATGRVEEARRVVDGWAVAPDDLRASTLRAIRSALVLQAEGQLGPAQAVLQDALERAEPEDLRRPFRGVPGSLGLLRTLPSAGTRSFASSILDMPVSAAAARAASAGLVEPLTERERSILEHLPTRLSNTDIAGELFISVNTMKTHLRNIYRKLDVNDRDAAVARATDLGLL